MKNPLITTLVAMTLLISVRAHAQFLPTMQSPYQQMGYPVSGAYPNSNPYNGSGQAMMGNCPYNQTAYDPASAYDKDPLVVSAKEDLKTASDGLLELRKKVADTHHELMVAELKFGKTLTGITADNLLKEAKACEGMAAPSARTPDAVRDAIKTTKGISGADAVAYCFQAQHEFYNPQNASPQFRIKKMCYSVALNSYGVQGKVNTPPTKNDECENQIDDTYNLYKTWSDANDELKNAQADQVAAAKEVASAREEAKKYNDEMVALGLNSATAGCPQCMAGQAQQQKSVMSNGKFWGALGLIGGISTLSILAQEHQYNNIARMGYIADPNQVGIISSGISSGMSAGYPFLQSSLYGQTPMGGMQGGYGCAQTMASSQFMQPQGPFMGGSNYFPYGGQYMPGASPMGVSPYGMPGMGMGMPGMGMGMPGMGMGMPGMGMGMPGMGMGMPGMGMGMPGMGMGMPGMGMGMPGMYNPYAQQAQYSQYMNQQMVDMMRQQQVAMYAIGYGLNNANQQYSYAQSILGGSYGMGGMGMGGMGMMPGMGMGMGMPGMMMPGMGYGGSPCGMGSLGGSISICGATGLGGSFAPTNTGYNYGGFAPAGYASPYGLGTSGLSTTGVVNFR